jgi:hypothetical protein
MGLLYVRAVGGFQPGQVAALLRRTGREIETIVAGTADETLESCAEGRPRLTPPSSSHAKALPSNPPMQQPFKCPFICVAGLPLLANRYQSEVAVDFEVTDRRRALSEAANVLSALGEGAVVAGDAAAAGVARARSHCCFVPPLTHVIPDSLRYSVPLFLKRQCDRTLGVAADALAELAAAPERGTQVRKTLSGPRSWANFSLF